MYGVLRLLTLFPAVAIALVIAVLELVIASEIKDVGREIAVAKCGACHATATTGDSPHPAAPAFRTLSQRYPLVYLEEALGEGIVTGHPDMPEIKLEPDAVAALLSYLASIQD